MPIPRDRAQTPAAPHADEHAAPSPDREMDADLAQDVRPEDGQPAAGTGFVADHQAPEANQGEREHSTE